MNTKIRTAIITLIAAGSFATATVAPAVSQADPANGPSVTCPGDGPAQPGDEKTTVVTIKFKNGTETTKIKEVCGSDGEWHVVTDREGAKQSHRPVVGGPVNTPPVLVAPPVTATPPVVVNPVHVTG